MTGTNILAASAPHGRLSNGGMEHGLLGLNAPILPWYAVEALLEVAVEDPMDGNHHEGKKCCVSYQKSRIPEKLIRAYEETDIRCANPGVIFTLNNGKKMCANPEDKWVQRVMKTNELKKSEITILSSTQPSV
ncbi:C-C motif chemokine 14-like [Neoarius graeffei]|uniref:C-C motif chemokine 14-like n=1 Tax=Neoarius graeffei TaxID=443677 RepID=UPI00298C730A|nr:C-C motif chemokine 14-like [Neoarius graeffei]